MVGSKRRGSVSVCEVPCMITIGPKSTMGKNT